MGAVIEWSTKSIHAMLNVFSCILPPELHVRTFQTQLSIFNGMCHPLFPDIFKGRLKHCSGSGEVSELELMLEFFIRAL